MLAGKARTAFHGFKASWDAQAHTCVDKLSTEKKSANTCPAVRHVNTVVSPFYLKSTGQIKLGLQVVVHIRGQDLGERRMGGWIKTEI